MINFKEGIEIKFKLHESLDGHVKEMYAMNYVAFPEVIDEFKDLSGSEKYF
jgi:hypothetical protein